MNREIYPKVKIIINQATEEAKSFDDVKVRPEHIVLSILSDNDNECTRILKTLNVDTSEQYDKLTDIVRKSDLTPRVATSRKKPPFSDETRTMIKSLDKECEMLNDSMIDTTHILLAVLSTKSIVTDLFSGIGINYNSFKKQLKNMKEDINNAYDGEDSSEEETFRRKPKQTDTKTKTPVLDNFCRDISKAVEKGELDPVVGRQTEIKRVSQILSRRKKNNPVLIGDPGVGKAQPLDAKILTPNGWVTMGEIKIGDEVLTPIGDITNVIGIFPQGEKDIYKITFKDGKITEACGEHLWKVCGIPVGKKRQKAVYQILDTLSIKDKLENTKYKIKTPLVSKEINEFNNNDEFTITPYLMGVILGDGCISKHSISVSSADDEILESVEFGIGEHYKLVKKGKYDYRITENQKNKFNGRHKYEKGEFGNEFLYQFNELGLNDCKSDNKFIPKKYMNTTLINKISLIQGLLDTDGTVSVNGSISYSTISYQLAKDVQELIWSIGGIASIKEKQTYYTYKGEKKKGKLSYNVNIRYSEPKQLFKLERKINKLSDNYQYKNNLKNEIVKIEYIGKKEAQCIMIEDENHLYITDDYIVTHNTAIVEGLAQLIHDGNAPRTLIGKRIFTLDLASIVAGTKYRGQFEERMKAVLEECKANPDVVLFIDELHTIVGAGNASGSLDASNIFKPALARGELQIIGATTLDEYRENIEKDGALTRRFQQVLVEEPTLDETKTILNNIKEKYEKHHKVKYTDEAIEECVKLSDRYIMDRSMPDKAIDVLDEAGATTNVGVEKPENIKELEAKKLEINEKKKDVVVKQKYEEAAKLRDEEKKVIDELASAMAEWQAKLDKNITIVGVEIISEVVSMMTGIPLTKISTQESKKLMALDAELTGKVIGQDDAVTKVVKAIKRNRIGIKDKNKPVGSFIFLGPTGVGKTHLAKLLAENVYGDADALVRMDMSEYMEKHSVSRLIGPPPGYVGYDQGGQLTEKVRRKPHCVILFDEIEKAHEDVFNLLLQLLDEGMLTDGLGRKINFKNALIILTSNIGVKEVSSFGKTMGFETASSIVGEENRARGIIEKALKKKFKPEFLNRIDEAIVFNGLTPEDIHKIIHLEISKLKERVAEMNYNLEISQDAIEFLGRQGYDEAYGARPLARAIQHYVEDPVADEILNENIAEGETIKITFDTKKEELVIKSVKPRKRK